MRKVGLRREGEAGFTPVIIKRPFGSIVYGSPWYPPEVCNPGKGSKCWKNSISRVTARTRDVHLELITFGSITHLPCVSSSSSGSSSVKQESYLP